MDWVTALAATATAMFAFVTWRTYARIEWLTGSMDSIYAKLLALEVEKMNRAAVKGDTWSAIEVVWWDPTIKPFPKPTHGDPIDNCRVYIGVPRHHRANRSTLRQDLTSAHRELRRYLGWPLRA